MDAEEQLVGLSGGLNGPKKAYVRQQVVTITNSLSPLR